MIIISAHRIGKVDGDAAHLVAGVAWLLVVRRKGQTLLEAPDPWPQAPAHTHNEGKQGFCAWRAARTPWPQQTGLPEHSRTGASQDDGSRPSDWQKRGWMDPQNRGQLHTWCQQHANNPTNTHLHAELWLGQTLGKTVEVSDWCISAELGRD